MNCILVSSCLLGLQTRYDATDNNNQDVRDFLARHQLRAIPVCPEQLAGFATPRPKCWFSHGDGEAVIEGAGRLQNEQGLDVTERFIHGAHETLKIAGMSGCQWAILQQRSPSCGTQEIYLNNQLISGMGVTAALLRQHGLEVFGDDKLPAENDVKNLHHE